MISLSKTSKKTKGNLVKNLVKVFKNTKIKSGKALKFKG